ncbi:MAG TPA: hypothetical protein VJ925_07425 [Longimicrobiales bacterium]|nr:hypothetical protein [Longimicrobiales bacterium]
MSRPARWGLLPLFMLLLPALAYLVVRPPISADPEILVPWTAFAIIGLGSGILVLRRTPDVSGIRSALVMTLAYLIGCVVAIVATFVAAQALVAIPAIAEQSSVVQWSAMGVAATLAGLLTFAAAIRLGAPGT